MILLLAAALTCVVTDGDTLRCGSQRIRLLGIDAPEMPGHCRKGRQCAPGNPYRSKQTLIRAVAGRELTIYKFGADRYGRTLAMVSAGKDDLSCYQLRHGSAVYKPQWDDWATVKATCPDAAR